MNGTTLNNKTMARLDKDRENELQPKRMEYSIEQIGKAGYEILYSDKTRVEFEFNGAIVKFFPYSGWHTGKTIVDGRDISKLLKQIQNNKTK